MLRPARLAQRTVVFCREVEISMYRSRTRTPKERGTSARHGRRLHLEALEARNLLAAPAPFVVPLPARTLVPAGAPGKQTCLADGLRLGRARNPFGRGSGDRLYRLLTARARPNRTTVVVSECRWPPVVTNDGRWLPVRAGVCRSHSLHCACELYTPPPSVLPQPGSWSLVE